MAGAFSIDGFGAPFVEGIDGDWGTVAGLSLPLLRRMLAAAGVAVADLWPRPGGPLGRDLTGGGAGAVAGVLAAASARPDDPPPRGRDTSGVAHPPRRE